MKFAAVCGSGLGTSFMTEMNIKNILNDLGVTGVEVNHYDVGSATPDVADVFFVASDLAERAEAQLGSKKVVILESIIDMNEIEPKVTAVVDELGLR